MSFSNVCYAIALTLICLGYIGCAIYLAVATRIAWRLGTAFFQANLLLLAGLALHLVRKIAYWDLEDAPVDIDGWVRVAVLPLLTEAVFFVGGARMYQAMRQLWIRKLGRMP